METPKRPEDIISAESLKQKRIELEARIQESKKKKDEDINKQVGDRITLISEDSKLSSLLEEAQGTLEYYKSQQEQGLLTAEDVQEMENISGIVDSLKEQQRVSAEKHEAIMSNPDVYGKVLEQAEQENESIDLKLAKESFLAEIEYKIENFINEIKALGARQLAVNEKYGDLRNTSSDLEDKLRQVLSIAKTDIIMDDSDTRKVLDLLNGNRSKLDYELIQDQMRDIRSKLGLFKFKEKKALDIVLEKKDLFDELIKNQQEIQGINEEQEAIFKAEKEQVAEYKDLIHAFDLWAEHQEIDKLNPMYLKLRDSTQREISFKISSLIDQKSPNVQNRFQHIRRVAQS